MERTERVRTSIVCALPGQLRCQESNCSFPRELGCGSVERVRSVILEKPVRRPRICVEREVLSSGTKDLLEISHGSRGLKFVRLGEVTEEGCLYPGIVAVPGPVEEDDCANVGGEGLR